MCTVRARNRVLSVSDLFDTMTAWADGLHDAIVFFAVAVRISPRPFLCKRHKSSFNLRSKQQFTDPSGFEHGQA